jgi:hypothetical protein
MRVCSKDTEGDVGRYDVGVGVDFCCVFKTQDPKTLMSDEVVLFPGSILRGLLQCVIQTFCQVIDYLIEAMLKAQEV